MLVIQALKYALGCVALLLENVPVVLQDLMNEADKGPQLGRYRSIFAPLLIRKESVARPHPRQKLNPSTLDQFGIADWP
jgi:hypothetical protein